MLFCKSWNHISEFRFEASYFLYHRSACDQWDVFLKSEKCILTTALSLVGFQMEISLIVILLELLMKSNYALL